MAWHCASWPGQLALLASPDLVDQQLGLRKLREDHRVWQEAQALAGGSIFLDKLTKTSPFSTCVLQDITAFACAPDPILDEELLQQLHAYCYFLFTGF